MKMRILHHNTEGLKNDAQLLKTTLEKIDIDVEIICYEEIDIVQDNEIPMSRNDVHIYIEHIHRQSMKYAKKVYFVPNVEWLNRRDYEYLITNQDITILSKTINSFNTLKRAFKHEVKFIGWTSRDMYIPSITKTNECLHVKGVSKYKQTQLLIDTWVEHPEWPMLHIVSYGSPNHNGYIKLPNKVKVRENITLYQYKMDLDDLKYLMNKCKYHICPSYAEGFGHYIVEGMSTGATVMTTDAPPMNEHVTQRECLFKTTNIKPVMFGVSAELDRQSLENTIIHTINTDIEHDNRRTFELKNKIFNSKIIQLFKK